MFQTQVILRLLDAAQTKGNHQSGVQMLERCRRDAGADAGDLTELMLET